MEFSVLLLEISLSKGTHAVFHAYGWMKDRFEWFFFQLTSFLACHGFFCYG